jgi:hypothetical protein
MATMRGLAMEKLVAGAQVDDAWPTTRAHMLALMAHFSADDGRPWAGGTRPTATRRRAPWLRSMRAEPEGYISSRVGITALERIVMAGVYLAVITLVVWLVFFAGSMVPSGWRG